MDSKNKLPASAGRMPMLVVRFPVDGPPVIPELAFSDGMRVRVGPLPGALGTIDWSADPVLSVPSKFHGGTNMRRDYAPCVPVRAVGIIGRITWHHPRWVVPHNV